MNTSCWNCGYHLVECTKKREAGGDPCCGECDHSEEGAGMGTAPRGLAPRSAVALTLVDGTERVAKGVPSIQDMDLVRISHVADEQFVHVEEQEGDGFALVNLRHVVRFREVEV